MRKTETIRKKQHYVIKTVDKYVRTEIRSSLFIRYKMYVNNI